MSEIFDEATGTVRNLRAELPLALTTGEGPRRLVLVEGVSDKNAVEALAERRGRRLASEGISVVPLGGATNLGYFLDLVSRHDSEVRLAGLCDEAEEGAFQLTIERAGLGANLTRAATERLGFFVCVADLEDELIRSLGAAAVEQVADSQGELGTFRSFQMQPAQRERPIEAQLHRFMGTRSGRKLRYGRLLVEALDLDRVPQPLDKVLAYV